MSTVRPLPWHVTLSSSIHALRCSAMTARNAYQRAVQEHGQAQGDAVHADDIGTAVRQYDSMPFNPYAHTLGQIELAQRGLLLSLSRVWHRTARTYAWSASHALLLLRAGEEPALATVAPTRQPLPALELSGLPAQTRAEAQQAERDVLRHVNNFAVSHWGQAAGAWHRHAEAVNALVWPEIIERGIAKTSAALSKGGDA
ncbi:hypothetical protein [Streptomyces sp. 891-h]|uniref:hypothetical protein n=1 Tax=Streptomyces sp. 891-h TaxID=2720714 RepID=UPI001FAA8E81|nr:hypothetical protein [Streptomyces sp. 891-h]UNZ22307.1 hypothetical protein HC362_34635 [Streptomyces sp. 891-h]